MAAGAIPYPRPVPVHDARHPCARGAHRRRRSTPRGARWTMILALALVVAPAAAARAERAAEDSPLTLKRAIQLARQRYERHQIATEQLRQARMARNLVWSALLPTLTAEGSFTHNDKAITAEFQGRAVTLQRQDVLAGSITARLRLLDPPTIPALYRAADALHAVELQTRWTRLQLDHETAQSYFEVLAARALVAAAERAVQTAQAHLEAVMARVRAGEAIVLDQTRARRQLVTARSQLIQARNTRAGALDHLAFLTGLTPLVRVQAPPPAPPVPPRREAEQRAQDRFDVRAARFQALSAGHHVTQLWMEFLPSFELMGQYQATQNTGFSGDNDSWYVMVQATWVLLDGGARWVEVKQQSSVEREQRLTHRLARRTARLEVRQARRDLETSWAALAAAQQSVELARQTSEMVLARYEAGEATSLELVDADNELRQAEVALVNEQLDRDLRVLALRRASGLSPLHASPKETE